MRRAGFRLALLALPMLAQTRFDLLVRDDFFAGMFGDRARLEKGLKATEQALRKDPRNAEALVWHGSGLLSRAANAYTDGDSQAGDRYWKRGIDEMNRARKMAPDNLGVLIGRAAPIIGVASSGFDPSDRDGRELLLSAVIDYEKVLAQQNSYLSQLSEHSRCELLFGLATGWDRLDESEKTRGYLEKIVQHCAASPYEREARGFLEKSPMPKVDHNCIGCHVSKK